MSLTRYQRAARRQAPLTFAAEIATVGLVTWACYNLPEYEWVASIPVYAPLVIALGYVVALAAFDMILPAEPVRLDKMATGYETVVAGWIISLFDPVAGAACMSTALGWAFAYHEVSKRDRERLAPNDNPAR